MDHMECKFHLQNAFSADAAVVRAIRLYRLAFVAVTNSTLAKEKFNSINDGKLVKHHLNSTTLIITN
jgi:hypothetical protein